MFEFLPVWTAPRSSSFVGFLQNFVERGCCSGKKEWSVGSEAAVAKATSRRAACVTTSRSGASGRRGSGGWQRPLRGRTGARRGDRGDAGRPPGWAGVEGWLGTPWGLSSSGRGPWCQGPFLSVNLGYPVKIKIRVVEFISFANFFLSWIKWLLYVWMLIKRFTN